MALNSSGPISLAGATAGQSIALELGQSATGQISLNDTNVRTLAAVASGAITMPTNFYGKSNAYTTFTLGSLATVGTGFNQNFAAAAALSSTTAVVFWNQEGGKGTLNLYGRYITISGNTVSLTGSIVTFLSNQSPDQVRILGATAIDSTYMLISLGGGGLQMVKLTGTTPAFVGSRFFGGSSTAVGRIQGILTSTTYLIGLGDWVGGSVKCAVATRSGDTLSVGATASLSTGGLTASSSSMGAAAGSSTTGVIWYNNRVYPVTVSGTTCTIGGSYVTATGGGSNNACCVSPVTPTANRYLVTAAATGGSNVGCVMVDQSGTSLSTGTGVNFSFTAGTVPASSFCRMMRGSSTAASVRGSYGNQFVINISGTTISATRTNSISTDTSNGITWDSLNTTQIITPTYYGNTNTGVATAA